MVKKETLKPCRKELLEGLYTSSPVRRVEIENPQGGSDTGILTNRPFSSTAIHQVLTIPLRVDIRQGVTDSVQAKCSPGPKTRRRIRQGRK